MFLIKKNMQIIVYFEMFYDICIKYAFQELSLFSKFCVKGGSRDAPTPLESFFFIAKSNFIVELFNAKETVFAQSRNVGP